MSAPLWKDAPRADFAVIGDPVDHSLSPGMHEAAYRALGLNLRYVAVRVPSGQLANAAEHLAFLGYRGVNVTLPLKKEAAEWSKEPDPFVERCGSANTLSFADGAAINTDALGFIDTLRTLNLKAPAEVLLLGAGGAARSIALALSDVGYKMRVFNRTSERAKQMLESLQIEAKVLKEPDPAGCSLIVNATAAGHQGESPPVLWKRADKRSVAYDLTYGTEMTAFLLQAALAGMKLVDGRELLVMQGARSFSWWLDREAPVDAMREAVH